MRKLYTRFSKLWNRGSTFWIACRGESGFPFLGLVFIPQTFSLLSTIYCGKLPRKNSPLNSLQRLMYTSLLLGNLQVYGKNIYLHSFVFYFYFIKLLYFVLLISTLCFLTIVCLFFYQMSLL